MPRRTLSDLSYRQKEEFSNASLLARTQTQTEDSRAMIFKIRNKSNVTRITTPLSPEEKEAARSPFCRSISLPARLPKKLDAFEKECAERREYEQERIDNDEEALDRSESRFGFSETDEFDSEAESTDVELPQSEMKLTELEPVTKKIAQKELDKLEIRSSSFTPILPRDSSFSESHDRVSKNQGKKKELTLNTKLISSTSYCPETPTVITDDSSFYFTSTCSTLVSQTTTDSSFQLEKEVSPSLENLETSPSIMKTDFAITPTVSGQTRRSNSTIIHSPTSLFPLFKSKMVASPDKESPKEEEQQQPKHCCVIS